MINPETLSHCTECKRPFKRSRWGEGQHESTTREGICMDCLIGIWKEERKAIKEQAEQEMP